MSKNNSVTTGTETEIQISPQYLCRVEIPRNLPHLCEKLRSEVLNLLVTEKVMRDLSVIYLIQARNMADLEKAYSTIENFASKQNIPVVYNT